MNSDSSLGSIPARAAALFLDCLILLVPQILFGYIFGTLFVNRFGYTDPTLIALGFNLSACLVALLIGWMYFAGFESSPLQATIGKKAFGLAVVTTSGIRMSFPRATGRYLARLLSGGLFGMGYVVAVFSANKQALHDMLANTLVVSKTQNSSSSINPVVTIASPDNESLYEIAQNEVDSNTMRKGIYALAYEQYPENEALRISCYISMRVKQLKSESSIDNKNDSIKRLIATIRSIQPRTLRILSVSLLAVVALMGYGIYYWYNNIYWTKASAKNYGVLYIEFKNTDGALYGYRGASRVKYRNGRRIYIWNSSSTYNNPPPDTIIDSNPYGIMISSGDPYAGQDDIYGIPRGIQWPYLKPFNVTSYADARNKYAKQMQEQADIARRLQHEQAEAEKQRNLEFNKVLWSK
jgi:uncharacterized RDD family membrane protein YckC